MTLLEKSALINYNIYFVLFSRVDGFSLTDPCLKKKRGRIYYKYGRRGCRVNLPIPKWAKCFSHYSSWSLGNKTLLYPPRLLQNETYQLL